MIQLAEIVEGRREFLWHHVRCQKASQSIILYQCLTTPHLLTEGSADVLGT